MSTQTRNGKIHPARIEDRTLDGIIRKEFSALGHLSLFQWLGQANNSAESHGLQLWQQEFNLALEEKGITKKAYTLDATEGFRIQVIGRPQGYLTPFFVVPNSRDVRVRDLYSGRNGQAPYVPIGILLASGIYNIHRYKSDPVALWWQVDREYGCSKKQLRKPPGRLPNRQQLGLEDVMPERIEEFEMLYIPIRVRETIIAKKKEAFMQTEEYYVTMEAEVAIVTDGFFGEVVGIEPMEFDIKDIERKLTPTKLATNIQRAAMIVSAAIALVASAAAFVYSPPGTAMQTRWAIEAGEYEHYEKYFIDHKLLDTHISLKRQAVAETVIGDHLLREGKFEEARERYMLANQRHNNSYREYSTLMLNMQDAIRCTSENNDWKCAWNTEHERRELCNQIEDNIKRANGESPLQQLLTRARIVVNACGSEYHLMRNTRPSVEKIVRYGDGPDVVEIPLGRVLEHNEWVAFLTKKGINDGNYQEYLHAPLPDTDRAIVTTVVADHLVDKGRYREAKRFYQEAVKAGGDWYAQYSALMMEMREAIHIHKGQERKYRREYRKCGIFAYIFNGCRPRDVSVAYDVTYYTKGWESEQKRLVLSIKLNKLLEEVRGVNAREDAVAEALQLCQHSNTRYDIEPGMMKIMQYFNNGIISMPFSGAVKLSDKINSSSI